MHTYILCVLHCMIRSWTRVVCNIRPNIILNNTCNGVTRNYGGEGGPPLPSPSPSPRCRCRPFFIFALPSNLIYRSSIMTDRRFVFVSSNIKREKFLSFFSICNVIKWWTTFVIEHRNCTMKWMFDTIHGTRTWKLAAFFFLSCVRQSNQLGNDAFCM